MKIKTFQTGGIVYLPTSVNQEAATATPAAASSSKDSEFTNSIYEIIKEKGLDSDVSVLLNKVRATLSMAEDPTGKSLSVKDFLNIAQYATATKNNYAAYEKARSALATSNAWGEVATTATGKIYALSSDGDLKTITPTEYSNSPEEYSPLSFEDLLEIRRSNSSLAYNTGILDDVNGAIGMDTVLSDIKNIMSSYKDTEITGFATKQGNNILSGMQEIINYTLAGNSASSLIQAAPNGIYKITEKGTEADKNINAALAYMLTALPNKDKRYLFAQAAVSGFDPEAFLLQTIINGTGRSITVSPETQLSKSLSGGSGGSEGGSTGMVQRKVAEMYATGEGGPAPERLPMYTAGSTAALSISGQKMGVIGSDRSGEYGLPMTNSSVAAVLEQGYGIRQVGSDTVTFGDQLLNKNQLEGIMYDGSDMYRVMLPAKQAANGKGLVPDFETVEKVETIINNGKNSGDDETTINRYLQEVCPGAVYDSELGMVKYPENKVHAFLTFGAVASSAAVGFTPSKYMASAEELTSADMPSVDTYLKAVQYGQANVNKNDAKSHGTRSTADAIGTPGWLGWGWGSHVATRNIKNTLYKANVYIPISDSVMGASLYNPEWGFKTEYVNIRGQRVAAQQAAYAKDKLNNPANTTWE